MPGQQQCMLREALLHATSGIWSGHRSTQQRAGPESPGFRRLGHEAWWEKMRGHRTQTPLPVVKRV